MAVHAPAKAAGSRSVTASPTREKVAKGVENNNGCS
jgi:hypothetical protein